MDLNKLTLKSQAALQAAQEQARARNNGSIEPAHLLFALLSDPEGVIYPLLHELGQTPKTLRDRDEGLIEGLPKVYGVTGDPTLSEGLRQVIEAAFVEAS